MLVVATIGTLAACSSDRLAAPVSIDRSTSTVDGLLFAGQMLTISVTALAGQMVAYIFEPHGTKFLKPLTVTQDLSGTNGLLGLQTRPNLSGGYFKSESQLNTRTNTAVIDESYRIITDGSTASFDITHFSGYMVSTGRSAPSEEMDGLQ